MAKTRFVNRELEDLRNSVQSVENDKEILTEIVEKTKNLHGGFLFYPTGEKLLQKLCLCLCATRNSFNYCGWKELGNKLCLDIVILQSVENCNLNNEDPVYNMFIAYSQLDDATIGKIYISLQAIKRQDIISETYDLVVDLYNKLTELFPDFNNKQILKPPSLPKVPFIIRNLAANQRVTSNHPEKRKYDKIIMLTFHSTDLELAQKIASDFRSHQNHQNIGVIILEEHAKTVYADPETFISNCYAQSDYIIPILTTDYLNVISGLNETVSVINGVDTAFLKYIYSLMMNDYARNGCRNFKIRCIIPDEQYDRIQKYTVLNNPEFRIWAMLSDLEVLKQRILGKKL